MGGIYYSTAKAAMSTEEKRRRIPFIHVLLKVTSKNATRFPLSPLITLLLNELEDVRRASPRPPYHNCLTFSKV